MRSWFLFAFFVLSIVCLSMRTEIADGHEVIAAASVQDARAETLKKYREVFQRPFDVEAVKAYMESFPKDGDHYIVEGDIALTEQELRAYIVTKSMGSVFAAPDSSELIVNIHNGGADYYKDPARRKLTYAVDRKSFPSAVQYQLAVASTAQAGKDWRDACPTCGVEFIYKSEEDDNPSHDKVNFIVRQRDLVDNLVALAFFPHDDASERYIDLDPLYFSPQAKSLAIGVLRHELGHVLGYRHEQIRVESGCFRNGENNQWQPLTPYDPDSVMHYFCRSDASNFQLSLTTIDKEGHRKLYGTTGAVNPAPQPSASSITTPAATTALILPQAKDNKLELMSLLEEVFKQPFDNVAVGKLMKTLRKDGDYYIVEGDLLLNEQELRAYLVEKSQGTQPANPGSPELIVNVHEGERDYYKDPNKRELTYTVDRASFPNPDYYQQIVDNMQRAGKAWQDACSECRVRFSHLTQFDGSPSQSNANFTVRYHDAQGGYIAAAFFPHQDASRRFVNIDPSYFEADMKNLKVGVLRHELGHVLGYRHEHTRGVAGCYHEDDDWQPLTDYNPESVMHYFCAGGGNITLELSNSDKKGHRKLYREYASPTFTTALKQLLGPKLIIQLEGGDVADNGAKILSVLAELNLLDLDRHKVDEGDTLESIYKDKLDFPFFSAGMKELADKLNRRNVSAKSLKNGEKIVYPDIDVDDYDFTLQFDPSSKKDQERLQNTRSLTALIKNEETRAGLVSLTLRGFEFKVRLDSYETLERVRERLSRLNLPSEQVLVLAPKKNGSQGGNQFFADAADGDSIFETLEKFWADYVLRLPGKIPENVQADIVLLSVSDRNSYRSALKKCDRGTLCPSVILIDQPVDRHPDIAPALSGGNETLGLKETEMTPGNGFQSLELGAYDESSDHGTYMAGIIASQDNKFGLVGLDPGAKVFTFPWTPNSTVYGDDGFALSREIQKRNGGVGLPIFVFASRWEYATCCDIKKMIDSNDVTKKIKNIQIPLWIVAAGQTKTGQGDDIKKDYRYGPMNLGDLPNVLVVTAYSLDGTGVPHLLPEANFSSQGLVHIAAPGAKILSTIRFSKYFLNEGTSPATAFVAGVASAMANTWPFYERADRIKFRLQLTATPNLDLLDSKKVASGTVDPVRALLDPQKVWLQRVGDSFTEVSPTCWNTTTLTVINPVTKLPVIDSPVSVGQIRRIYRVPDTTPAQWIIYTTAIGEDDEIMNGRLKKIGPGRIDFKETETLLMTGSGPLSLSVIKDFIFPEVSFLGNCAD